MAANGLPAMLPLKMLLNPDSAEPAQPLAGLPAFASTPASMSRGARVPAATAIHSTSAVASRSRKTRDPEIASRTEPRGPIKFPPFEDLDGTSLQLVTNFGVRPFGQIHQTFEHFPYNSEKRDLLDKTGRESIEAFTYEFSVPGNDAKHVVMWDYNIGIVRLASLFRLCGFNKTGPAQTFSKNPGLLQITPNITGGAVPAQGKASARRRYWFPYHCAKAICARFCHHIAGALIPVFGPRFPSECTPPDSLRYRRLDISPHIVLEATRESELSKQLYLGRDAGDKETVPGRPLTGDLGVLGSQRNDQAPDSNKALMTRPRGGVEWDESSRKRPRLHRAMSDIPYRQYGRGRGGNPLDVSRVPGTSLQRFYRPSNSRTRSQATRRTAGHTRSLSSRSMQAIDPTHREGREIHGIVGQRRSAEFLADAEQYDAAMVLVSLASVPASTSFADDYGDDGKDDGEAAKDGEREGHDETCIEGGGGDSISRPTRITRI